jgi:hypothetical protein
MPGSIAAGYGTLELPLVCQHTQPDIPSRKCLRWYLCSSRCHTAAAATATLGMGGTAADVPSAQIPRTTRRGATP